MKKETQEWINKVTKAFQRAVKKAQEEHRKLGIPNVYWKDDHIVYEYDGKLHDNPPPNW